MVPLFAAAAAAAALARIVGPVFGPSREAGSGEWSKAACFIKQSGSSFLTLWHGTKKKR